MGSIVAQANSFRNISVRGHKKIEFLTLININYFSLDEKSKQPQLETVTIRTTPQPVTIEKPLTKDKELIQQEEEQQTWRRPNPPRLRDNHRQESPPKTRNDFDSTFTPPPNTSPNDPSYFYISTDNVTLLDTINSNTTTDKKVPDDKENTTPQQHTTSADSEVILRRTHSFESDDA